MRKFFWKSIGGKKNEGHRRLAVGGEVSGVLP